MSQQPSRGIAIFGSAILFIFSIVIGALLCEAGYRYFLYQDVPERFTRPTAQQLGVYDKSHWVFDEEFGYGYPPKRVINYTNIVNGRVSGCGVVDVINEQGNIGPIVGNYDDAEIKIAVFGDSWAAFNINHRTWPSFLQEILEKKTGKKVNVVNFGRDGYGILQMFDLAAAKVKEWKPDIAIISFITNDLARVRTWRTEVSYKGAPRLLTTFEPKRDPDLSTAYDTFLINPKATNEWCLSMKGVDKKDSVIEEIEAAYNRARSSGSSLTSDIWATNHSYLLARVRYGNPFHGLEAAFYFPSLTIDSYALDPQYMKRIQTLKEAGIPVILFHMAFYPEIKEGQEYITNYNEERLLRSLSATTGWKIYETTAYVDMPVDAPERMNASPENYHPSLWGMEFYANAVSRMLIEEKFVQ